MWILSSLTILLSCRRGVDCLCEDCEDFMPLLYHKSKGMKALDVLKLIVKIFTKRLLDKEIKKPELKFNPGLGLIGL